jgi:hypothetical protein
MAGDGDAVYTGCVFNGADCSARIRIQYIYPNSMRDIKATSSAIDGDIVPSSIPAMGYRALTSYSAACRGKFKQTAKASTVTVDFIIFILP